MGYKKIKSQTLNSSVAHYIFVIIIVSVVGGLCWISEQWLGYHSIGFLFLITILTLSIQFSFGPTFFSAFWSALIWNFFFIPPKFTFNIKTTDDFMMLVAFFIVALTCGYYSSVVQRQRILIESEKSRFASQLQESFILRESEKLHQTLLNSVSHELRTPLTSILGVSSALLTRTGLSEDLRNYLEDIRISAKKLQELTQELLDMSRLSSGVLKPKFELFELNDFMHQVLTKYHDIRKGCQWLFEENSEDLHLLGDEGLLEICMLNLLKNSVHYSPPDSTIKISTSKMDEQEGAFVVIKIRDFGIGISSEEEEKLFLPFYHSIKKMNSIRAQDGLGLGLSIAKSIVDLHGGSIQIKNVEFSNGTEVTIKLLLAEANLSGIS